MSKTFVIGDIHGGYLALNQVLERAKVSSLDTLIFLGDYVDGWSQAVEVIDLLLELKAKQPCIFMKGNHEEFLINWLKTKQIKASWELHGGKATIKSYSNCSLDKQKLHLNFLENLEDCYIDDENRLFLHAGFTHSRGVESEYHRPYLWWDRTLWETVMALDPNLSEENILYPKRLKLYKEIFIGHTPTIHFQNDKPMHKANVWNVDTGAAFTGKVTILNVNTKEFWQSDALPSLYPTEIGRNKK